MKLKTQPNNVFPNCHDKMMIAVQISTQSLQMCNSVSLSFQKVYNRLISSSNIKSQVQVKHTHANSFVLSAHLCDRRIRWKSVIWWEEDDDDADNEHGVFPWRW